MMFTKTEFESMLNWYKKTKNGTIYKNGKYDTYTCIVWNYDLSLYTDLLKCNDSNYRRISKTNLGKLKLKILNGEFYGDIGPLAKFSMADDNKHVRMIDGQHCITALSDMEHILPSFSFSYYHPSSTEMVIDDTKPRTPTDMFRHENVPEPIAVTRIVKHMICSPNLDSRSGELSSAMYWRIYEKHRAIIDSFATFRGSYPYITAAGARFAIEHSVYPGEKLNQLLKGTGELRKIFIGDAEMLSALVDPGAVYFRDNCTLINKSSSTVYCHNFEVAYRAVESFMTGSRVIRASVPTMDYKLLGIKTIVG